MKIGLIIGRIGGLDGVALEAEKWIDVLRRIGHEVYILSGQFQERKKDPGYETLVTEMSLFSPESFWGQRKAYFFPDNNIDELLKHIDLYSKIIYKRILKWVKENNIEILLSENASSLPSHLTMGFGISKAVKKLGIPTITHDHDFAWERGDRYVSPYKEINDFVAETFPLRLPNVIHAVININAKETLKKKFGCDSIVVPNVMDFNMSFGKVSEKNKLLKRDLGLSDDDILLFQITRIVSRKCIEVAIKLIDKLKDKKIKLIITGNYADDEGSIYYHELVKLIHDLKLRDQVYFAYNIFHNKGLVGDDGEIYYSLSDAYAQARACTYFSCYEGFGNAFVEAILAKRPVFLNNYKPVYWPDIGSKGFKTVMLEDNVLTDNAVEEMKEIIYNAELNKEIAEHNFKLGEKYFSYDTLEQKLEELINLAMKKS